MNSGKILKTLLAITIGVGLAGCPAKPVVQPTTTPTSPSVTASQSVTVTSKVTPVANETKEAVAAVEDMDTAMDAAEEDPSADSALGTLAVTALGDKLPGVIASALPNVASKINLPKVKRAIKKAETRIRAAAKKIQKYLPNISKTRDIQVVDNGDGTVTHKVTREFKAIKAGAQKTVATERTFTKLDTTKVENNKVTGGLGQPVKFYHKYVLTLPNGATREAERTITFNYGDDGNFSSRSVTFKSTLTLKDGKTQTVNMSGEIKADGSETKTGEMVLLNGKKLQINTTINADGSAKRTATGEGAKVELNSTAEGTKTVTTTDTTTNAVVEAAAPVTDAATETTIAAETGGISTEIGIVTEAPTTTTTSPAPVASTIRHK